MASTTCVSRCYLPSDVFQVTFLSSSKTVWLHIVPLTPSSYCSRTLQNSLDQTSGRPTTQAWTKSIKESGSDAAARVWEPCQQRRWTDVWHGPQQNVTDTGEHCSSALQQTGKKATKTGQCYQHYRKYSGPYSPLQDSINEKTFKMKQTLTKSLFMMF